jgi:hypothetical protein
MYGLLNILYNVGSLITLIILVRLQNTPLCLLHCFIYDSTSHCNLSSYNTFWALDILPRSGPLMSSVLNAGSRTLADFS